jgi:predicted ATPase
MTRQPADLAAGRVEAWMRDLRGFREAVREHRRAVGRTQQQLARSIGLHPDVLSHKLNSRDNAVLTSQEVVAVATTLVAWGALVTRNDMYALLTMMEVPPQAVPAAAWSAPPLAALRADQDAAAVSRDVPGPRAHAWALASSDERAAPPKGPAVRRSRMTPAPLPAPATALIGRERERAEVAAALAASRLVTLTGVGGTGKTRLALQVACDVAGGFADGVAFADLAPVRDPALLATTMARALGLTPTSAETAEAHLAEALLDRELLLVVDNLEQLLDETQLLARVLAAAPAVRVLATSRIALRLYGEHVVRIPPLDLPGQGDTGTSAQDSEAVQLFIARARAARPGFAPDAGELAAVGGICTAVDGLPLAIELAAARIRLYSPQALLPLLRSRLALLTGGPRDLPYRQQTLRAALDWSYALLPPGERRLFACLGVFAGLFDADAATAVAGEREAGLPMLGRLDALGEHSLLEVTAGDPPRFRMLQTVREYALARLAETGETEAVQAAHLRHHLEMATEARDSLEGADQGTHLDRLQADLADIYAALDWARSRADSQSAYLEDGLRLATAVAKVWRRRASVAAGRLHLERLLAIDARTTAPAVRAWALIEAAALAWFAADYPSANALASEALTLCAALGDLSGQSWAHRYLGSTALASGDLATAEPHLVSQLATARRAGDGRAEANAHNMLGQLHRYQGRYRQANIQFERALQLFRAAGDPDGTASVLNSLGEVARDAGQADLCRSLFRQALNDHYLIGSKRGIAADLEGIAAAEALDGKEHSALIYLGAAQGLRDTCGWQLTPTEQAALDRLFDTAAVPLSPGQRQDAITEGRNRPLAHVIDQALSQAFPCR